MKVLKPFFIIACLYFGAISSFAQNSNELSDFGDNTELEVNKISLYPMPATSVLNVEIDNSTMTSITFELYNIIGNSQKVEVERIQGNVFRVNVNHLNKGYYLLSIVDEKANVRKAFRFQKR